MIMEIANDNIIIVSIGGTFIGLFCLKLAVNLASRLPAIWKWLSPHWYRFRVRIGFPKKVYAKGTATIKTAVSESGNVYAYCSDDDKGNIPIIHLGILPEKGTKK